MAASHTVANGHSEFYENLLKDTMIAGYEIKGTHHQSIQSIVYDAVREIDQLSVAIKMSSTANPPPLQIQRRLHEYEILKRVEHPGVMTVYEMIRLENDLAIVMEKVDAIALGSFYQQFEELPTQIFFDIAFSIVEALSVIHQHQIIHSTLEPNNILVNPNTYEVKLIDFSRARLTAQGHQGHDFRNIPETSWPYMAPEQTGRAFREVDYRCDYYALGVILYQLLTKTLPFGAEQASDWVQCHLSQVPVPPHELSSRVPESLSYLILKLMAKDPEHRYQSVTGLVHDLRHCQEHMEASQKGSLFMLGTEDVSGVFRIPQKLYGRHEELNLLKQGLDKVLSGSSELMLVLGYSGVGKSVLVQHLKEPVVLHNGFFLRGKFDQYQKEVPYSAVLQAFRYLLQKVLGQSETQIASWKARIKEILADEACLVAEVMPELKPLIEPGLSVQSLPPQEAQRRFFTAFKKFLKVFATRENPLVVVLDDLQWSDTATLKLLESVMADDSIGYFLIVGVYRSNEVGSGHLLNLTLEEIQKSRGIRRLFLKALTKSAVLELVSDTLHCSVEESKPLAELVFEKTKGNPLFINEFLQALHHKGLIQFVHETGRWDWELEAVQSIDLSDNVVDFVIHRLQKLPKSAQLILQRAACIGNRFDTSTLSIITGEDLTVIEASMHDAIQGGIVLPMSTQHHFISKPQNHPTSEVNFHYQFQHDRIQQAAYALIEPEQRSQVHLQIARLLYQQFGEEEREQHVMELCWQFNSAFERLEDNLEKEQVARLNLLAGQTMKKSAVYRAALDYFQHGIQCLGHNHWKEQHSLSYQLFKEASASAYLCQEFQFAEEKTEILLLHAQSEIEKAEILALQAVQHASVGHHHESINSGVKGLEHLKASFNKNPGLWDIVKELIKAKRYLRGRSPEMLLRQPMVEDPKIRIESQILKEFGVSGLSISRNYFAAYSMLKLANLAFRYGSSPETPMGYAAYGYMLGSALGNWKQGRAFGEVALELLEKDPELSSKGINLLTYSIFIHFWSMPLKGFIGQLERSIELSYHSGDLRYAGIACFGIMGLHPSVEVKDMIQRSENYLSLIEEAKFAVWKPARFALQKWRNLYDLTEPGTSFSEDSFDESLFYQNLKDHPDESLILFYNLFKLQLSLLYHEFEEALEHANALFKVNKVFQGTPFTVLASFYGFMGLAQGMHLINNSNKKYAWAHMKRQYKRVRRWAKNCHANFGHYQYIMEAEMARLQGRTEIAGKAYDLAIAHAEEHQYISFIALCHEWAACYYEEQGQSKIANFYLNEAKEWYSKWGARRKVRLLEQQAPLYHSKARLNAPSKEKLALDSTPQVQFVQSNEHSLELASIIKACQTLSEHVISEKLHQNLIHLIMENCNAQRGLIWVSEKDTLLLKAIITPEGPNTITETISIHDTQQVPLSLIHYTIRSQSSFLYQEDDPDSPFSQERYFEENHVKSAICIPLLYQKKLLGAIYLENYLDVAAFSNDAFHTLQWLALQAAAALENANLYYLLSRRPQAIREFSEKVGGLKSAGQMLDAAFHYICQHVVFTYAAMFDDDHYLESHNAQIPAGFFKTVLPEGLLDTLSRSEDTLSQFNFISKGHPLFESLSSIAPTFDLHGSHWLFIKLMDSHWICLFREAEHVEFNDADGEYIFNILSEVQLVQKNLHRLVEDKNYLTAVQRIQELLPEILYISHENPYCHLEFNTRRPPMDLRISLQNISSYFSNTDLLQIHRSYLIQPKKVVRVERKSSRSYTVILNHPNRPELPISRGYLPKIKKLFPHWFEASAQEVE